MFFGIRWSITWCILSLPPALSQLWLTQSPPDHQHQAAIWCCRPSQALSCSSDATARSRLNSNIFCNLIGPLLQFNLVLPPTCYTCEYCSPIGWKFFLYSITMEFSGLKSMVSVVTGYNCNLSAYDIGWLCNTFLHYRYSLEGRVSVSHVVHHLSLVTVTCHLSLSIFAHHCVTLHTSPYIPTPFSDHLQKSSLNCDIIPHVYKTIHNTVSWHTDTDTHTHADRDGHADWQTLTVGHTAVSLMQICVGWNDCGSGDPPECVPEEQRQEQEWRLLAQACYKQYKVI